MCDRTHRSRPLFAGGHARISGPAMNSRLEKVRKLKLDVSEKAPAPARRWVLWLLLAIFVGSIAFLVFKNAPLPNSISRTVEASTASAPAAPATSTSVAPTETLRLNQFTAAGYVEPMPPFPIHISPLVLGRIDEFTITEGQPVKAGQIIAKLNSQEFEKRLAELQAALGVNAERLALAESELARSKKLAATGWQPGRNWSRPVQMPPFCGRRPRNSRPRFKPSSGRFSKRRSALRSTGYCLSDWRTWAVTSIPTRTGKLLRLRPREVANMGGREPARRCPLARRAAGGSHSRCGARQGFYRGGFANSASRIALEEYDPGKNPSP